MRNTRVGYQKSGEMKRMVLVGLIEKLTVEQNLMEGVEEEFGRSIPV